MADLGYFCEWLLAMQNWLTLVKTCKLAIRVRAEDNTQYKHRRSFMWKSSNGSLIWPIFYLLSWIWAYFSKLKSTFYLSFVFYDVIGEFFILGKVSGPRSFFKSKVFSIAPHDRDVKIVRAEIGTWTQTSVYYQLKSIAEKIIS